MFRLLILLLTLLVLQPCMGAELTPGSYRIEYGGLYKLAADESRRFVSSEWAEQEFFLYNKGMLTWGELTQRSIEMTGFADDWRNGPPWWTRNWWDSLEPHRGGAPPNGSILVKVGSQYELIDTAFFTLTNSLNFKWKSVEASVDFKSERPISLNVGDVPTPSLGWKFKVSPEISFSPMRVFSSPTEAIRRLGLRLIATHYVDLPLVSVEINTWYDFNENRAFIGVLFTLLRW